ncbi:hypothetical protein [Botryobacter ruber]|uniref:hypothetical protein n=1 Tax=Botryobacter ruber TaxID=2171629 RepID=UPI000E0B176D|nr:hypothetical protein [Botryobacter ruber]
MQLPTADWVWDVHEGVDSFADFCEKIAKPFILPPALPEKLKEEFLVVHKLLQHAYFECRFIDIALLQASVLFEKVLKSYYQETEEKNYKGNLQGLINHFVANNHFEHTNANEVLHVYRDIRNRKVHDVNAPNGLLMIRGVYRLIYFVNELYEDQNLRNQRANETKHLQSVLNQLIPCGAALEIEEGRYVLVYDAKVLFINNKKQPSEITVAFWPEFDLKPFLDGVHHYALKPLVKKVHSPNQISTNVLELMEQDDKKIRINGELIEPFKMMYNNWLKQALSLPNVQLVMQLKESFDNEEMEKVLNEFYSTTNQK